MQTEQPTTQPQTQTKKVKKTKSSTEQTPSEQSQSTTQQTAPAVVQTSVPTVTTVTEEVQTETHGVTLELDFNTLFEFINVTSDRIAEYSRYFKDNTLSKDERSKLEAAFKKFDKVSNVLQSTYSTYLNKQVSLLEKNSGNKSSGPKKVTDKEKSAIHKKLPVHPFLLKFMKLEPNTLVSRSDALTAITGFVKEEKLKNPAIIVENDKRSFKLIGELKKLFDKICYVKWLENLDVHIPSQISYPQILSYVKYCFPQEIMNPRITP